MSSKMTARGSGYQQKREELVEARLARRALFDRKPAPLIELILEESMLRRPFGSWEILRRQLRSLAEDARRENVCVQVLPLDRGLRGTYAGARGAMKLVETADHEHVVYMEIEDQGILVSDPSEASQLAHRYARIRSQALRWFKSSYSDDGGGNCLEVAPCPHTPTTIHIRDSKHPDGPIVTVSGGAWAAFLPTAPLTP